MTTDPGAWIAQEQAIAAAATDGPWVARFDCRIWTSWAGEVDCWSVYGKTQRQGDAEFVAHARTGYPLALDALAAVLALCDRADEEGVLVTDEIRFAITDRIGGGQ